MMDPADGTDSSQNTTLREKFVNVLGPVIASGDEDNIATLISSLSNICHPDTGLLIPHTQNYEEYAKTSEFICWLISELLTIKSSRKVHEASILLQVNIFQLIGARNSKLFPKLLKDYINIGQDATNILFNGGKKIHHCFTTAVDQDKATLKAKDLILEDNDELDHLLSTVVKVLSHLGGYLILYSSERFPDTSWQFIGQCLEGGDTGLKSASLEAIALLLDVCCLPFVIEKQDYIIQLIGGCILAIVNGDFKKTAQNEMAIIGETEAINAEYQILQRNFSKVIHCLRSYLNNVFTSLLPPIILNVEQFLQNPQNFILIEDCLLRELLLLAWDLTEIPEGNLVCHKTLTKCLENVTDQSMKSPQVIEICLKQFLFKDFEKVIPAEEMPSKDTPKKRTFYQSEHESVVLEGWCISAWWSKVVACVETLSNEMSGKSFEDSEAWLKCLKLLQIYLQLGSEVIAHYSSRSKVSVQLFSCRNVQNVSELLSSCVLSSNSTKLVAEALSVLKCFVFVCVASKLPSTKEMTEVFLNWAGIGSLPWMANEMNFFDLKPPNKTHLSVSSKATWISDQDIKRRCIPILSMSTRGVAPNWRCHVIKIILSEGETIVLEEIVRWFPMALHQLPNSSSHVLLAEFIGKVTKLDDKTLLKVLGASLRYLLCSISNQTEIRPKKDEPCSSSSLYCRVCEESSESSSRKEESSSAVVDSALVDRLLLLMESDDKEVVLASLEGLSAVASHTSISCNRFQTLMMACLKDEDIGDVFAEKVEAFVRCGASKFKDENLSDVETLDEMFHSPNSIQSLILSDLYNAMKGEGETQQSRSKRLNKHRQILRIFSHYIRWNLRYFEKEIFVLVNRFALSSHRETLAFTSPLVTDWAKQWSLTPKDLYVRNRKLLAQVFANEAREGEILVMLNQLAEVFCWGNRKDQRNGWISYGVAQLRYLLPPMAEKSAHGRKPNMLQELAAGLGLRLRDMLIDHFQYILAYLVFHCSEEDRRNILSFIASTTNITIANIRKCSIQNQVNELILGLDKHRKSVLKEFLELRDVDSEQKSNLGKKRSEETRTHLVGEFLAPRLLGILGFLDGKLVSSQTMPREKESVLLCLSELLVVVGKDNVSPVARKVIGSLKTAFKIKSDHILASSCRAWAAFLSRLDESTLESIIEEAVVLCLPLLKANPEVLAPVFKTILVDSVSVQHLLQFLPFLPQHPTLAPINEAISNAQSHFQGTSKESVVGQLESIKRSLNHESQEVRLHSLRRLKSTLKKNQNVIHQLILDSTRADKTVSDIFHTLLGRCRESEELLLLVSECLGLFGAIDPSRLHSDHSNHDKLSEIYTSHDTAPFLTDLVMTLSRAFLSATDASTQTCASYALQEILRMYKINSSSSRSIQNMGHVVYNSLPVNVREILKPLHSSKYTVTTNTERPSYTLPSPIYRTKYSKTFDQWVTRWTCSLIDLLIGQTSKQLFTSCKPLVRRDPSTALHLLPPLLVCVLTEAENNKVPVTTEILCVLEAEIPAGGVVQPSAELQQMAVQTIFSCLDYIRRWSQGRKQQETTYKKNTAILTPSSQLQYVLDFLDQIPAYVLAQISFKAQAYSRALIHLESHLAKHPQELKANLAFLQSIYVALDEPDGVAGVAAIQQEEPSIKEQIIQYEAIGRLHDALGCYERLIISQESQESYEGMLKCYLTLGQPQSVLNITQGLISRKGDLGESLHEYRVEAAWRLGQWDQLETLLSTPPQGMRHPQGLSWGEGIGKALLAAREGDGNAYWKAMHNLRVQQITPLSAASMEKGAYQRAYPCILRLQILNEMDEVLSGLLKISVTHSEDGSKKDSQTPSNAVPALSLQELIHRWNQRFSLVQTSQRFLEPLLNFRRTLLSFGIDWVKDTGGDELRRNLSSELERCWLKSAKVARKAGHLQQGELSFYGAGQGRDVFMERAKWHWVKGEQPQAVAVLKRGIQKFFPSAELLKQNRTEESLSDRRSLALAKLLLAQYSEESATLDVTTIKQYYRDVCEIDRQWEDGHFNLAMYYDRILATIELKEKPSEWLLHIVQSFGKSLSYGCQHLYQSMPRLLTIWLDHGAKVVELQNQNTNVSAINLNSEKLISMNTFLNSLLERLPSYMFFIALPQLISRICHSHKDVFVVLCKIIASMLVRFPQQSMWHMIAVSKSSYQMRRERCQKVFEMAKRFKSDLDKFIFDSTKLADLLIELSDKMVPKGVLTVSLRNSLRALPRLLADSNFSNIILPVQHQMNVTLPSSYGNETNSNIDSLTNHNPFLRKEIYISGIEDEVEVMTSLVRPKKVTFKCSDGLKYIMMCKPKDDMRKDCRLMEFNSFVNLLLMKDPESRKRGLKIRTYMVVPLNEECGLVEWIPNLCSLRMILHKIYREKGLYVSGQDLRSLSCRLEDSLSQKRNVFLNILIPKHPPVFSQWFLLTFVDCQAWLRARWAYCRTTAVMSMVGYIVGLGDRHGENILMDSQSGDSVHVDFNCLFNKGETFEWPERVPFRLTQNMVSAMGPTGYEGIFRTSCEVTMRVMRKQRDELMSVLRPFLYDPLVEWEKEDKKGLTRIKGRINKDKMQETGEICNAQAQNLVKNIEERLSGRIRSKARGVHLPLSTEGQVNVLIEEATSIDNLCQMYSGWTAYM